MHIFDNNVLNNGINIEFLLFTFFVSYLYAHYCKWYLSVIGDVGDDFSNLPATQFLADIFRKITFLTGFLRQNRYLVHGRYARKYVT